VTRNVTGVFGRDAESFGSATRSALGSDTAGLLTTPTLALAWTGGAPAPGRRTVLLAGRVRNLPELAIELGAPGDDEAETLLALAYDRWGEAMLERLRGGFVLVVWDPAVSAGLLAVDQLGVGGLYLAEAGGRLTFATELKHLARALPRRPAPARSAVAQWIADGFLARGETLLEGVRRLAGGSFVRLQGGRWLDARYWQPRYASPEKLSQGEASEQIRSGLIDAVRSRADASRSTAIQLSGGLDSSTVAAIARSVEPPLDLRVYSLVFPDHVDLDESQQIEHVERALGLPAQRLVVRSSSALGTALEFQHAWDVPAGSAMLAFNVPLLRQAARDGVAVILDGEGGDELFGCSEYLIADYVRRGDLVGALRLAKRLPWNAGEAETGVVWAELREYGLKGAAPAAFHRAVRRALPSRYTPRWLTPEAGRRVLEARDDWAWKRHDAPRWWAYLSDLLIEWRERMGAHDLLRQRAALSGVENAHPLLDDLDLIELVLRLPPDLAFHPELTRPLVREAVAGLLPDEIRLRPDKADFSRLVIDSLGGPDLATVEALLGARDAELWAYVRPEEATKLLRVPAERRSAEWARLVARLVTMESWLRSQTDPELPGRLVEQLGVAVSGGPPYPAPRRAVSS
jgi:asparagine synthase (glutamine-hydrolysing)